jgi:hypothetical protein
MNGSFASESLIREITSMGKSKEGELLTEKSFVSTSHMNYIPWNIIQKSINFLNDQSYNWLWAGN